MKKESEIDLTQEETLKYLEDFKSSHKLTRSEFNIVCPKANPCLFEKKSIYTGCPDFVNLQWCQFKGGEERLSYRQLEINFQFEVTDLTYIEDPKCFFMLAANEKNPGFIDSKRWKWIGLVCVSEALVINWCWLHPYFRGQGIMKTFLAMYICNGGIYSINPPISKSMNRALIAAKKFIESDEELKKGWVNSHANYLKSICPYEDFHALDYDEMYETWISFCLSAGDDIYKNASSEKKAVMISSAFRLSKYLRENPKLLEEMQNDPKFDHLKEIAEKQLKEAMKINRYGIKKK